jgi:hypothetical protein
MQVRKESTEVAGFAFILMAVALAFIASGMQRHQRDLSFAPLQYLGSNTLRRYLGFAWLIVALLLLSTNKSLSHALVEWLGLFSVACLLTMALSAAFGKKG